MFVLWRVFIQSTSCKIMSNQTTLSGFPMNGSNFAKGTSPTKKPPTASSRALQASWNIFAEGIPKKWGDMVGLILVFHLWFSPECKCEASPYHQTKPSALPPMYSKDIEVASANAGALYEIFKMKSVHRKECASLHAKHQRTSLVFCLWDLKVHILRTYFVVVPTFSSHK